MEVIKTPIDGCFELQPKVFKDDRGKLIKTFHEEMFKSNDLETDFKEEYYSVSNQKILRGLHFQLPPHDHIKCVTCIDGKIFDVVVDLRKKSTTYKQYYSLELDSEKGNMLYIVLLFSFETELNCFTFSICSRTVFKITILF